MPSLRSARSGYPLLVAGAVGSILVAVAAGGATGGFNGLLSVGPVAASASLVAQVAAGGTICTSSGNAVSTDQQGCSGSLLPSGAIPAPTAVLSGTATVTDLGTGPGTGMLSGAACGALGASDASGNNNPGLLYNGIAAASGPFGSSHSLVFNGSNGWIETTKSYSDPSPITEVGWFRSSGEGTIVADTGAQGNGGQTTWDRQLWIDNGGNLVYGVYPGGIQEVVSTALYNTGQWYFVAASVGPQGQQLYVDGSLAAPINTAATSAQNYAGWFHIGWGSEQTWPNAPTDAYFNGQIADVAVFNGQLTAAQILGLYTSGTSQPSFSQAVTTAVPGALGFWPLQDSGYLYPDAIPGATGSGSTPLLDSSANGNTGTAEGGVTLGVAGPYAGGQAAAFDGSTGYVQTLTAANPQVLTESAWFNTTTGGVIMGLTSQQSDATPANYDRAIWLDGTGQVVYGDWPGQVQQVVSPGSYNNGRWHLAVAEVGPAGEQLYVDGVLVASNASYTVPQIYTGWWHLGYGNETVGWTDPPSSNFFAGSLADLAVYPTQLNATQVADLYAAANQSAETAAVLSLGPTSFWTLGQSGTGVCGSTALTIQETSGSTTNCLLPTQTGACPALSGTGDPSLGLLAGNGLSLGPLGGGSSLQLTFHLTQEGPIPTGCAGLHPTLGLQVYLYLPGWTGTVTYAAESLIL